MLPKMNEQKRHKEAVFTYLTSDGALNGLHKDSYFYKDELYSFVGFQHDDSDETPGSLFNYVGWTFQEVTSSHPSSETLLIAALSSIAEGGYFF